MTPPREWLQFDAARRLARGRLRTLELGLQIVQDSHWLSRCQSVHRILRKESSNTTPVSVQIFDAAIVEGAG